MATVDQILAEGVERQARGDLVGAEARYRQILATTPEHAAATPGLGLLAAQCGRAEEAIALLRKAVGLDSSNASFHANLGAVLAGNARWEEAAATCREAIRLRPGYADGHVNLGTAL